MDLVVLYASKICRLGGHMIVFFFASYMLQYNTQVHTTLLHTIYYIVTYNSLGNCCGRGASCGVERTELLFPQELVGTTRGFERQQNV